MNRFDVHANELTPGQRLATEGEGFAEIESAESSEVRELLYNLEVTDFHTYFVGDWDWDAAVWVHNAKYIEDRFQALLQMIRKGDFRTK